MDGVALTLIFLLVLFTLLGSSVWIGISLLAVAWVGMELFTTRMVGDSMALTSGRLRQLDSHGPAAVRVDGRNPVSNKTVREPVQGSSTLAARAAGGLLHVNIAGSAIFAAICGSSAATVLTVGKMAVPELKRRKYPEKMIIGTLAGAGTLGLLIPPSIILIIYGVTVNESIVKLFIAGVIPGIMLALMFMGYVAVWDLLGGRKDRTDTASYTMSDRIRALGQLGPIMLLILSIMGSITFGYATATEAAVLGVLGAFAISWQQGHLTRENFISSLKGATRTSCMIAFILAGSAFLTLAMGFTGLPRAVAEWIAHMQLSPAMLIAVLAIFYIVLGCFLDGISSIVLTMAVVEPMPARQVST